MRKKIIFITSAAFITALLIFIFPLPNNGNAQKSLTTTTEQPNRLQNSLSPYLRQHANNPVDWHPWDEETLKKAKQENKMLLLSVGYSTCYWCHVMERETFTQHDVAQVMNKYFINVKIDREVRPDLDTLFMTASHIMTNRGGWPNNIFLTPDLEPFFAVTYLPKARWINMVENFGRGWDSQPEKIKSHAKQTQEKLHAYFLNQNTSTKNLQDSSIKNMASAIYKSHLLSYDRRHGGFGAGMKFPDETALLFLLEYAKQNNDNTAHQIVQNTLDHMIAGGIHDHIGGGFHRYSTTQDWRTPHFEKMLYTQALMATLLTNSTRHQEKDNHVRALDALLHYVVDTMRDKENGFYSAQDAQTNGVEGAYYTWSEQQLKNILSPADYTLLTSHYALQPLPDIGENGQHAQNITTNTTKTPDNIGGTLYQKTPRLSDKDVQDLAPILQKLKQARDKKEMPQIDKKILLSWNGMMIYALAQAGITLDKVEYINHAQAAADFILEKMQRGDGRFYRIYMDGTAHQDAFLEDYAWFARALSALYQVTNETRYKTHIDNILTVLDRSFYDNEHGGYFMTPTTKTPLIRIKMAVNSGALPTGNAIMAHLFSDLHGQDNDKKWIEKNMAITTLFSDKINQEPLSYPYLLQAAIRIQSSNDMDTNIQTDDLKTNNTKKENPKPSGEIQPPEQPQPLQSKDKVSARAAITQKTADQTSVAVTLTPQAGWHINTNPASLDFLIPTSVDIQTNTPTDITVTYPKGEKMTTPLGTLDVYKGETTIKATLTPQNKTDNNKDKDKTPTIDLDALRALVEIQACYAETCYPPSQISIPVKKP